MASESERLPSIPTSKPAAGRQSPSGGARRLRRVLGAALMLAGAVLTPLRAGAQDDGAMSLIQDTEVEEILRQDADPIFIAAGLEPKNVQIHLVGDKELNAFVSGGQQMFVFSGLIMEAKTPNQLIGVIAHETGHMAGGHLARSGEGEKSAMRTFMLTMGLGLLAALAGAPDAGAALMYSSNYFATLNYLGYTRIQESQADQAAITYLEKAHESAGGLVDFFDTFRYEEVFSQARRYPYFQSHPLSTERIETLRVRAEKQPSFGVVDSPEALERHKLMVAKLKAFINPPGQTFVDYKESDRSFPARYARAIAYHKAGESDRSVKLIDALLVDQPNNPYLYELKGQVLFESGRTKESEAPHRRSVELKPDAPLLRMNLGQTLIAEEDKSKLDEAIDQIGRAMTIEKDNAFGWRLLAQAYDAKGEAGMARLATAEQEFALGQLRDARVFAMRARELLPKNTPQWRRATDIVLVSQPSNDDLQSIARQGGFAEAR